MFFSLTRRKVIAELPETWKTLWHTMVPAQRFCDPYELKGVQLPRYLAVGNTWELTYQIPQVYVFLASDASSYMTGTFIFPVVVCTCGPVILTILGILGANLVVDGAYSLP